MRWPPLFCTVVASLALWACNKKEAASPPAPAGSGPEKTAASASDESTAPVTMMRYTYKESPQKITSPEGRQLPLIEESTIDPKVGEVLVNLTMQLRRYIQEKGRAPESIGQLISARMDSAPQPPKGTMYVIDAKAKEVRLVKIK